MSPIRRCFFTTVFFLACTVPAFSQGEGYVGDMGEEDGMEVLDEDPNEGEALSGPDFHAPPTSIVQREMPPGFWDSVRKVKAFDYHEAAPQESRPVDWGWAQWLSQWLRSPWGYILWGLLACGALVWALLRYYSIRGWGRSQRDKAAQAEPDMSLRSPDRWKDAMQEAARQEEYGRGIAFAYNYLLELMYQKGTIGYQEGKTNRQYIQDLSGHPFQQTFASLCRRYEQVNYGRAAASKVSFEEYAQQVEAFKHSSL